MQVQSVKKEAVTTSKNQFYNNYDIYRRDNEHSPISLTNAANGIVHSSYPPPAPTATAATVVPTPPVPPTTKQSSNKNRFNNSAAASAAAQESYFHGYYGKQQPEYYGKYEIEFAHHQKSLAVAQNQLDFHHQKSDFSGHLAKPEFHHIKADFHHIKPEQLALKGHHAEFHAKNHNFHPNQSYYNQHHAGTHGSNANQMPVQYANQYYHSEYDGTTPGGDPAAYYDPKGQPNYYENLNYHHGDYQTADTYATAAVSGGIVPDNCNNFVYPQYYETGQSQQPHLQPIQHQQHGTSSVPTAIAQPHHQVSQVQNHHANAQQPLNFNHGPQPYSAAVAALNHTGTVGGAGLLNGNHNNLANHMENSNSSSDFNFLSNLANDFAPEYYQLS